MHHSTTRHFAASLVLSFTLGGCSFVGDRPLERKNDHSFIDYWPPAESSPGTIRLAVKDLIDVKGYVTSAGSEFLEKNMPPATRDARCLRLARARSDVQFVGKTNLTELAVTASGVNGYYGTPRNPLSGWWRRIPGGSSSGSAVAVAIGMADIAFGTDTAGSIRTPAACCGVFGLKTTLGLVPLDGVFPISPKHLDTVGPLARTADDLKRAMELLDPEFTTRPPIATASPGLGLTVGRLYVKGTATRMDRAVDAALEASGFRVVNLGEKFQQNWAAAEKDGKTVAVTGAWLNDRELLDKIGISSRTRAIILAGRFEYPREYEQALANRRIWRSILARTFDTVDFIALPTLKDLPPRIPLFAGSFMPIFTNSILFEAELVALQNTVPVNFAGNPALAIPIPSLTKKFPVASVQLVGPRFSEAQLIEAGRIIADKSPIPKTRS